MSMFSRTKERKGLPTVLITPVAPATAVDPLNTMLLNEVLNQHPILESQKGKKNSKK